MYPYISWSNVEHLVPPKQGHKTYKERCCQLWCAQASLAVLFQFPHTGRAIPMLHVAMEAEAPAVESPAGKPPWECCSKGLCVTPEHCSSAQASRLGQMSHWHPLQLSTKPLFHSPTVYLHFCISAGFFWLQRQPHLQGFIFLFDTLLLIFLYCTKELAPVPLSQLLLCSKWKP